MAETISTVGLILDLLVLGFILHLHSKEDDRTWNQRLGATMMCWFLVCHSFMHIADHGYITYTPYGTEMNDMVITMFSEGLWKVAILGFIIAAITIPMPFFKNVNHYKIGLGALLLIALLESYYTWGPLTSEKWFVWFWPFWSGAPALMMLLFTYLAWNYLTSPEGAEDRTERFTDRAGLFAVMALFLWGGKNWFDWMGFFTGGGFFYSDGMPNESSLHFIADAIGKFEMGMMVMPLLILSIGSVIYLRNRGSWLLGGLILSFLVLGYFHNLMFSGAELNYNLTATLFNEDSFKESFQLLTHGTMQSLARPLIVLFLVVRFGMIQTQHNQTLSRAMTIMVLAGAMSVVTEILQPMMGVPQLLSGFFLGAILAFEIERKIMAAMEPPEGEENPEWKLDMGEGRSLVKWTNWAFAAYLYCTIMLGYMIAEGVFA